MFKLIAGLVTGMLINVCIYLVCLVVTGDPGASLIATMIYIVLAPLTVSVRTLVGALSNKKQE